MQDGDYHTNFYIGAYFAALYPDSGCAGDMLDRRDRYDPAGWCISNCAQDQRKTAGRSDNVSDEGAGPSGSAGDEKLRRRKYRNSAERDLQTSGIAAGTVVQCGEREYVSVPDVVGYFTSDQDAADVNHDHDGSVEESGAAGREAPGICRQNRAAGEPDYVAGEESPDTFPVGSGYAEAEKRTCKYKSTSGEGNGTI